MYYRIGSRALGQLLQNFYASNYVAIVVISVKIIGKYAVCGINKAKKGFITLTRGVVF